MILQSKITGMARFSLTLFMLIWCFHARSQEAIAASSGEMFNRSNAIDFVLGGDIIGVVSSSTASLYSPLFVLGQTLIAGMEVQSYDGFSVYPNPFYDRLFIRLNDVHKIELLDSKGVVLKSTISKEGELDVSDLSQGLYLIRIINDRTSMTIKAIKYDK